MPRTRPLQRSISSVSNHQTAANGESFGYSIPPTSMFQSSRDQLFEDGVPIFDPSEIALQSPDGSLKSFADRTSLMAFTSLLGGPKWSKRLKVSFDGRVTNSSVESSKTATTIVSETSWYFDPENLRPGAEGWKLEREIAFQLKACEGAFPQSARLRFINDPTPKIPGCERLRKVSEENSSRLADAESGAFVASVIRAIVESVFQPPRPNRNIIYEKVSLENKKLLIRNVQREMVILNGTVAESPGHGEAFQINVVRNWLHMVAFNGKLADRTSQGVSDWFKEDFAATVIHGFPGLPTSLSSPDARQYRLAIASLAMDLLRRASEDRN